MVSTTADVSACSAAQATASSEPRSWGELLNSYRDSHGSRSYSTTDTPVRHYTRSVPGLCPLAETHHPLFSVGATGHHTISECMLGLPGWLAEQGLGLRACFQPETSCSAPCE
jgi:hypothetical protein